MNTAQSNAAGDRRERRFTLKLLTQIGIIFGICWISTCIERVLPFTLPASIINYADVLRENLLALVVVCAVSLIATFAATVGAVRLTCRLLERGKRR